MIGATWILGVALWGCSVDVTMPGGDPATEAPSEKDTTPAGVAKVANEISESPDDQAKILEKHGWTAADLEARIWEIAKDPEQSAAYKAARD